MNKFKKTHTHAKMADDVNQRVEDVFNTLVSITEKSGNLSKDLKKDILVSVSTLRKEFSQLKIQLETVNEEHRKLRDEVKNVTEEMAGRRDSQSVRQVVPTLDHV
jgi:predicted  nucleic acid-binding Zn-ribbon protein